jgi:molybdate transport system substrate-binding protein
LPIFGENRGMPPRTPERRRAAILAGLGALLAPLLPVGTALAGAPREAPPIAAAADLKFALTEVAERFERDRGARVRLSFGSSGNFTQQIENGAPFQLFLSADEAFVARLAARGLTVDEGLRYAIGRIALFAPHGSPLEPDDGLEGLRERLAAGRIRRFAIANPEHAPYGRAARAALEHAGLWQALSQRLVLGENAAQAMQFAASGASQGGIVALALVRAPEIARLGRHWTIPAEWHASEPLRQRMVLLRNAGATARAFVGYLQEPAAREVFARHGFALPQEDLPTGRQR